MAWSEFIGPTFLRRDTIPSLERQHAKALVSYDRWARVTNIGTGLTTLSLVAALVTGAGSVLKSLTGKRESGMRKVAKTSTLACMGGVVGLVGSCIMEANSFVRRSKLETQIADSQIVQVPPIAAR